MQLVRKIALLCMVFFFYIQPVFSKPPDAVPPFALITIPKSGSHLIIKTLHLLTGGIAIWHTRFPSLFYIPGHEGFLYTHFCLSPELEENYADLPGLKKIIMIRDLRDVCISIVYQIRKGAWPGLTEKQRRAFLAMPFEQQLLFVMQYDYDVHQVAEFAPNSIQVSIGQVARQAHYYAQDPSHLVCRYESLVGPKGGGSITAQVEEIRRIAEFLQLSISVQSLYEIASLLYGNEVNPFGRKGFENFESTFQHGQVGRWRALFNEEHKRVFKEKLGEILIALGYEKDHKW